MATIVGVVAAMDVVGSLAPTVLGLAFKSALILGGAVVVTVALRKASAAARHMVWTLAVASLLALPVLTVVMPEWRVAGGWPDLGGRSVVFGVVARGVPEGLRDGRVLESAGEGQGAHATVSRGVGPVAGVLTERPDGGATEVRRSRDRGPSSATRRSSASSARNDSHDVVGAVRLANPAPDTDPQPVPVAADVDPIVSGAAHEAGGATRRFGNDGLESRRSRGSRNPLAATNLNARFHPDDREGVISSEGRVLSDEPGRSAGSAWAIALVAVWVAGAIVIAGVLLPQLVRLQAAQRSARVLADGPIGWLAAQLSLELGVRRRVRILEGDADAMPMTWGIVRPIVLLPSTAREWPAERLRTVLLHELAHVRRRDYAAQLAAELACAVYWFNPLAWLAARRLRLEREHACDDVVLRSGTRASAYAQDLLDIARSLREDAALAAVRMARPSQLHSRLLALLDGERDRTAVTRRLALSACLLATALVLPLAAAEPGPAADASGRSRGAEPRVLATGEPARAREAAQAGRPDDPATGRPIVRDVRSAGERVAPSAAIRESAPATPRASLVGDARRQPCWERQGQGVGTQHTVNNNSRLLRVSSRECSAEIRVEGELRFTPDFTAIAWISPGGLFRASEEEGRSRRELIARPARDGVELTWLVDGRDRPFDQEAATWLSETLLVLFRRTGYAADERVDWLLARGGENAVLEEIALLQSNSARRAYTERLIWRQPLDSATLVRLIRDSSRRITSNTQLAGVLGAVAERYPLEGEVAAAFVEATRSISSNTQRAGLLVSLAERYGLGGDLAETYFDAARGITSNTQMSRVLTAAIERGDASPELVVQVLRSAEAMSSNTQKMNVLLGVARSHRLEGEIGEAYLRAANTITSSTSLRRALAPLLEQGLDRPEHVAAVLRSAGRISSSSTRAALLAEVARFDLSDPALQRDYLDAVMGISSSSSKRQALSAIVSRPDLRAEELAMVLVVARTISSSSVLADLLVQIAANHRLEGPLRNTYLDTADSITSRSHYGRAINALLRQEGSATS